MIVFIDSDKLISPVYSKSSLILSFIFEGL